MDAKKSNWIKQILQGMNSWKYDTVSMSFYPKKDWDSIGRSSSAKIEKLDDWTLCLYVDWKEVWRASKQDMIWFTKSYFKPDEDDIDEELVWDVKESDWESEC